MFTVRPATIRDARAIAHIRVSTWRAAYEGLIDDAVLAAMDAEREAAIRTDRWTRDHAGGESVDLIAVAADGAAVGWASYGGSRDERWPDAGELSALYALPDQWGRGVGHALMRAVEDALREAGYREAFLWVLEGNDRAARFYEAHGWAEDGTVLVEERPATEYRPAHVLRERRRVRAL